MHNPTGSLCLAFAAAATLAVLPAARAQNPASPAAPSERTPVLVELFTSEGCSSCPPADKMLEVLDAQQPIPGAQVIVLSEHVTYWNHDGWTDPYSLMDADQRQDDYVQQFSLPSPATPEFVVDGAAQVGGYDPRKVAEEISAAASVPKSAIQIEDAHKAADGSIDFTVKAPPDTKANLVAAVAENATSSVVSRGENKGQTLENVAVVRVIKQFGSNAADGRSLRLSGSDLTKAEKDGSSFRLVVFLVNKKDGHVEAVAQQMLNL